MKRPLLVTLVALVALAPLTGCGASQSPQSPASTPTTQSAFTLRTVAGYLAPEDTRGVTALSSDPLTEASPVWYQPTESGGLIFASSEAQKSANSITAAAQSRHIALMPSLSNYRNGHWDSALIHGIITEPQKRATHITAILDIVQSHQWAGIDIDYESLYAADRSAFSAFALDLSDALHQAGKRLSVTVHAKTTEPGDWSGARAQDWQALGKVADEVRVMAYDYSTENSSPGAIAPLPWVDGVLQLAVSEIPHDKILLGVPTYGYDWRIGQSAQDVQWAEADAIAQAHNAPVMWDPTAQSSWFAYTDSQGRPHTVWFEDARSMKAKLDLALTYRIGGVAIWRLGGEDPAIWEHIGQVATATHPTG